MKKIILSGILLFVLMDVHSQTLIATSLDPAATAHHNQRKIVRDSSENIFIVFTDTLNHESVIKGVKYEGSTGTWDDAAYLVHGRNPTLAIDTDGRVHMIYESNDSLSGIMYTHSADFSSWTQPMLLSDTVPVNNTLPVADVDSAGRVNIFWIEKNDSISNTLMYACVLNDTVLRKVSVMTKKEISDVAIANHLLYAYNALFFAIQFNTDSVLFFVARNDILHFDTAYESIGYQPCITYNSYVAEYPEYDNPVRFQYIDSSANLMEVETYSMDWNWLHTARLQTGIIDYICIDDLAPPIGYGYLFMKNGNLFQGFSYGAVRGWSTVVDTIAGNPFYPSIAYKYFNFNYVDYIWMEDAGSQYNIFYNRAEKLRSLGLDDPEENRGFTITGYPNPFSDVLTIKLAIEDMAGSPPQIKIYNQASQLMGVLDPVASSSGEYEFLWSGTDLRGNRVNAGIYVITCAIGNRATAKKVVFLGR